MGSSLQGAIDPTRSPLQDRLSMESPSPLCIHLLHHKLPWGIGAQLPLHCLQQWLQQNLFSGACSISFPLLHWPWCLQTFLILSFGCCCTAAFSSFKICYHRQKTEMLFLWSYSFITPRISFGHQLYLKPIYIVTEHFKFTMK